MASLKPVIVVRKGNPRNLKTLAGLVLSWVGAYGVFGAVTMGAGAVRGRTEVLPTAIYLEVSIGRPRPRIHASAAAGHRDESCVGLPMPNPWPPCS